MEKENYQKDIKKKKPAPQQKAGKYMEDPRYMQQDQTGNYDIDGTSYDGSEISLAGDKTRQNPESKKKITKNN